MRASAFRRYLLEEQDGETDSAALSSRLSVLSPSLMMDLQRFERDGRKTELLEVVAASARHHQNLAIHLQCNDRVLPLTLFPSRRLAYVALPLAAFLNLPLWALAVLHVEPADWEPEAEALAAEPALFAPLSALTWALAMRGRRAELLPEIPARAAFRVPPGVALDGLTLPPELQSAVRRLQQRTTNLRDIASWPGLDREHAMRLLNALYLQAGLMVSRTHPAATSSDLWRS